MTGRVLVLGGTGVLGPEVCRALLAGGAEVHAFNRGLHPDRLPEGVTLWRGDRRRSEDLRGLWRVRPDAVVDTAGWFSETLPEILETFLGQARIYVLVSSVAVYSGGGRLPRTEESATGPHPVWGELGLEKRRCEEAVERASTRGLPGVVLRLAHLYRPAEPGSREGRLAALLAAGREIAVPDAGEARLQFVEAGDVALLCGRLACAPLPPARCYNVAAEEIWTIRQWIAETARRAGVRPVLRFLPFDGRERSRFLYWPGDVVVDPGRLARDLGFRPRSPLAATPQEILQ